MHNFTFQKKTSLQDSMKIVRYLESIEDDGIYDIEIKKHRQKRSLNANAYCWVLCEKLAQKLYMDKKDVYRHAVKEVGVFDALVLTGGEEAFENLNSKWQQENGIGWFAEKVDKKGHHIYVNLYYGSSTYDTKEMSRLIDNLVQDCKACGIETLPPDELERMMGTWESA